MVVVDGFDAQAIEVIAEVAVPLKLADTEVGASATVGAALPLDVT